MEKTVNIPNDAEKILNEVFKYNIDINSKSTRKPENKQNISYLKNLNQNPDQLFQLKQIIKDLEKKFSNFLKSRNQYWT